MLWMDSEVSLINLLCLFLFSFYPCAIWNIQHNIPLHSRRISFKLGTKNYVVRMGASLLIIYWHYNQIACISSLLQSQGAYRFPLMTRPSLWGGPFFDVLPCFHPANRAGFVGDPTLKSPHSSFRYEDQFR